LKLEFTVNDTRDELKRLRDEVHQLHTTRKEFEEDIIVSSFFFTILRVLSDMMNQASAGQANQELRNLLAKRDAENLRLRDQRDQQAAELVERKHKDSVKMTSLQELKNIAESRSASHPLPSPPVFIFICGH